MNAIRHFQPPHETPDPSQPGKGSRIAACGQPLYQADDPKLLTDEWATQFEAKTTCPDCRAALGLD